MIVTFDFLNGGANNQKLALFGLLKQAMVAGSSVVLPKIVDFTPGKSGQRILPFSDFFDMQGTRAMLSQLSIDHVEDKADPEYHKLSANECFAGGAGHLRQLGFDRVVEDADPLVTFVRGLALSAAIRDKIGDILQKVNDVGVELAVQLRIEADWQEYSKKTLSSRHPGEDFNLSFSRIFQKINNTEHLSGMSKVFVCCDEDNMTVPKQVIKDYCRSNFGKEVFFKSCFANLAEISETRTALSLVDFELCKSLRYFVGLSRSTFSNLLCFTKAVTDNGEWAHYIYNGATENVVNRVDAGTTISPSDALSNVVAIRASQKS